MYVWSPYKTRVRINRTGKMNISLYRFAPENLVSRDGFGRPVPRQPAHLHNTQTAYIWRLLTEFLPISAAASIYLFKPPYAIGSVPSLSGHAIAYRWRSLPRVRRHRASKPQGIVPVITGAAFASPWTKQYAPLFSTPTPVSSVIV